MHRVSTALEITDLPECSYRQWVTVGIYCRSPKVHAPDTNNVVPVKACELCQWYAVSNDEMRPAWGDPNQLSGVPIAKPKSITHKDKCPKCEKDKEKLNAVVPGLGDATEKVIDVLTFGHGHDIGRILRGDD